MRRNSITDQVKRRVWLLMAVSTLLWVICACRAQEPPTPSSATQTPTTGPSITATRTAEAIVTAAATITSSPVPTLTHVPTHTTSTTPTATTPPNTATPVPSATPTQTEQEVLESSLPYLYCLVVTAEEPPVYYAVAANQFFRSTDLARTWAAEPLGGVPQAARVIVAAIDYRHPDTMYLGTDQGLYRRERPGEAWQLVHTMVVSALAVDLENSDILYAGTGWGTELSSVLVKSEDRGRTWGKADHGMARGQVTAILIDPDHTNVLWAHVRPAFNRSWPWGQIYRGGRDGSWERLSLGEYDMRLYSDKPREIACSPAGLAYDPNSNNLYTGCDITYYGGTRHYQLLRSGNADSPDSSLVAWELAADWGQVPETFAGVNTVRPLAVDAREPRSVIVFVDRTITFGSPDYRLMIGQGDDSHWEAVVPQGLGGNVSQGGKQ